MVVGSRQPWTEKRGYQNSVCWAAPYRLCEGAGSGFLATNQLAQSYFNDAGLMGTHVIAVPLLSITQQHEEFCPSSKITTVHAPYGCVNRGFLFA